MNAFLSTETTSIFENGYVEQLASYKHLRGEYCFRLKVDIGNKFIRITGNHLPDYTVSYPKCCNVDIKIHLAVDLGDRVSTLGPMVRSGIGSIENSGF
jgi:hypothetical protein